MTGTPDGLPPTAKRADGDVESDMKHLSGVAFQFALSLLAFGFIGQWLDKRLGTAPWLLIIGVFVGGGLSFYSMYRKLMAAQARDDAARRERQGKRS